MSRRILEVALAAVLGAVVVAIGFALTARTSGGESDDEAATRSTTTAVPLDVGDVGDVDEFFAALLTSQQAEVVVVGSEQRLTVDVATGVDPLDATGVVTDEVSVRRARLGTRAIEQIGGSALVVADGMQRSCSLSDGQFLCTEPVPAPDQDAIPVEFTDRLVGDDAPYDLFRTDDGCWRAVAVAPSPVLRWGQVSVWCFDEQTGALVTTARWTGDDRVVRFEALEVSTDVSSLDLDPQP